MFKKKSKQVLSIVMDHFALVKECYGYMSKFMAGYLDGVSQEELMLIKNQLDTIEHTADEIRKNLVTEFLDGSMLPQTRKEVIGITGMADKVADKAQSLVYSLLLEKIELPAELHPNIRKIIDITGEQLEMLEECIGLLFDNYDVLIRDRSLLHGVSQKEHDVDVLETMLVHTIYNSEMDLINKYVLKHFLSRLCDISDLVEDISDEVLEMVVLRRV